MNKLEILSKKGVKIKSNELVEIINQFRKIEGRVELQHRDFMKKIRKEVETLVSLGLGGGGNFSLVKYTDNKGEQRPCYELTAKGMRMMLNAESTLVRYKTEEYIENLESKIIELQEQNQKLILEAKESTILMLEAENRKISKILQADNYIKSNMYGEETYITSIVINIFKKCATKNNILKKDENVCLLNESPVKDEYSKYNMKDAEFRRYIEYFGGCKTKVKCKAIGANYYVPIVCYSIPAYIIDFDIEDSLRRLE